MTAVCPVVIRCGGLWVGWPGIFLSNGETLHEPDVPETANPETELSSKQAVSVYMNKSQFDGYYNGCCNGTFWPLFHSLPDRAVFSADHWKVSID